MAEGVGGARRSHGEGDELKRPVPLATLRSTREGTLDSLRPGQDDPGATAAALSRMAKAVLSQTPGADATREGLFWKDYADGLEVAADLQRWDAAVRSAEPDADRYRRAALRRIETLKFYDDTLFTSLTAALVKAQTVSVPADIPIFTEALARVPVPTRLVARERPSSMRLRRDGNREKDEPLVICLLQIDGAPITHAHVIHINRIYELGIRIRATEWPAWATYLRVELLAVVPDQDLSLPVVDIPRPANKDNGGVWSASASGSLVLRVRQAPGAPPLSPSIAASFVGSQRTEAVKVAGYRELRVRAFDESRDQLTGAAAIDERLLGMYAGLHGSGIPDQEIAAFCRCFSAISRAAQAIQADRQYGEGRRISEGNFHDDLERRLRADPTLGGRLERRTPSGGGYLDLLHDMINAELKVEHKTPATVERADKYMGQPVQYATDRAAQLSILCILDRSAKQAPAGELPNYFGWLVPALHGLEDPRYPSRVGVIIINANLPVPSQWSRRRARRAPNARRGRPA
jgi:hypothetical protein